MENMENMEKEEKALIDIRHTITGWILFIIFMNGICFSNTLTLSELEKL